MSAGWEERAACRNLDQALFYPAKGDVGQADRARAVCARCPVREACLSATLVDEKRLRPSDREGIRGGLDGRERYIVQNGQMPRRSRRKAVAKPRRSAPKVDVARQAAKSNRYHSPRRVHATADERPECGTRSGYQWHTAHHEIPCEPCTAADLAVTWFIRLNIAA
jgi:hypothetical protein